MAWDCKDQLQEVDLGGGGTAYYVYDAGGERVRKVIEKTGGIVEERIYLGGFEIYRKTISGTLNFERETLRISDDRKAICDIETKTVENGTVISSPVSNIRYQYDNHLGSASLELDSSANIVSYEEYHPFGTTSYRSGRTETEVSLKRYKYVGKERDEETGLYYYGARYYAGWIARFVSVDPLQHKYPYYTPFQYAGNKPVSYIDLDGLEEWKVGVQSTQSNIDENGYGTTETAAYSGTIYGPYTNGEAALEAYQSGNATMFDFQFAYSSTSVTATGFNNSIDEVTTSSGYGYIESHNIGDPLPRANMAPLEGNERLLSSSPLGYHFTNSEESIYLNGRSTGSGAVTSTTVGDALVENFVRQPLQDGLEYAGMNEKAAYYTSSGITLVGSIVLGKFKGKKASDLDVLSPNEATKKISNLGKFKTNLRVETASEAKEALKQARGSMNRYKQYSKDRGITFKKGYEVHNQLNPREIGAGNDLQHILWKDGKSGGHIYFLINQTNGENQDHEIGIFRDISKCFRLWKYIFI
jgi:RHS repeat-associated protein